MVLGTLWADLCHSANTLLNLAISESIPGTEGRGQVDPTCRWMNTSSSRGDRQQRNTTRDAFKIVKGYESSQMGDWLERRGQSEELPSSRNLDDSKEPPRAGHVGTFTKC